jgi:hypothetical protein
VLRKAEDAKNYPSQSQDERYGTNGPRELEKLKMECKMRGGSGYIYNARQAKERT